MSSRWVLVGGGPRPSGARDGGRRRRRRRRRRPRHVDACSTGADERNQPKHSSKPHGREYEYPEVMALALCHIFLRVTRREDLVQPPLDTFHMFLYVDERLAMHHRIVGDERRCGGVAPGIRNNLDLPRRGCHMRWFIHTLAIIKIKKPKTITPCLQKNDSAWSSSIIPPFFQRTLKCPKCPKRLK